jgi:dihydroflavonol-4-reductase
MTVTVTGATGHLGGHLVRSLLEEGRKVRVFVHDGVGSLEGLPVEVVRGDILDAASVRRAFEGSDVVYHLAARISLVSGDEDLVRSTNVDGVRNVVDAVRGAGVRRLVHFSSIHAYTPHPVAGTVDETWDLTDGTSAPIYDRTKAMGERIVRGAVERKEIDAVIINPTGCLGPLDFRGSAAGKAVIIETIRGRLPAIVEGGFNWVDVRDVVRAAMTAEKKASSGSRYIVGGEWKTLRDTTRLVAEEGGAKPPRIVLPMWVARAAAPFAEAYTRATRGPVRFSRATLHALRHHRYISCERARVELGYSPRPLRETIKDSIAWYRQSGVL